ncbi:MAG: DUF1461 domain-containing protein [Clostridia bacterium]|nr:DUF1461 domain-containing protein [Clostridia bacterium]
MRNTLGKLCIIFATLILLFSVAFFTVSLILKDNDSIEQKYKELGVSEDMGIATPDLARATTALLDYMRGERADIKVEAKVFGETEILFPQEKEIVHMAEVQSLWIGLRSFALFGAIGAAALLLFGFFFTERGKRRAILSGGMFWGCGIFGGMLAFLGIWAVLDFNSFWTIFHFIIFPASLFQYLSAGATVEAMNELNWMLDANSRMVRMLMPIFPPLVMRCALCVILEIAVVALAAVFIRFAWRKQGKPSPVADIVVIEHDANEPVPIKGPDLVLAHKLRNAPVSKREELLRRAKNGEPLDDDPVKNEAASAPEKEAASQGDMPEDADEPAGTDDVRPQPAEPEQESEPAGTDDACPQPDETDAAPEEEL